jgi:ribosomal-protein-alanine N-acetyltransferase
MTEPSITIEPMSIDHIPQVYALERVCFTAPWDLSAYLGELRNPSAYYLVAMEGHHLLGYGGMWVVEENAHVVTLAVRPDSRRGGLGRKLMDGLLAEARRRGAREVTLEVRAGNTPAQQLYTSMNFITVARRRGYYPDNNEDALVMLLEL